MRVWDTADAPVLSEAVERSLEHLRPWMVWAAYEPLALEARVDRLARFRADWASGGDASYGIFVSGQVAGGCGLHRRRGPETLEIGYGVHVDHIGQGLATEVASALTTAAFTVPGIRQVEIHHDRANVRSRAVPRKLGYEYAQEQPDGVTAPAEEGIDCCWVMRRERWTAG